MKRKNVYVEKDKPEDIGLELEKNNGSNLFVYLEDKMNPVDDKRKQIDIQKDNLTHIIPLSNISNFISVLKEFKKNEEPIKRNNYIINSSKNNIGLLNHVYNCSYCGEKISKPLVRFSEDNSGLYSFNHLIDLHESCFDEFYEDLIKIDDNSDLILIKKI